MVHNCHTCCIGGFGGLFPLSMYDFISLKINMFLFFCEMLYLVKFFFGGVEFGVNLNWMYVLQRGYLYCE